MEKPDVLICQTGQSDFWPMCCATICFAEPSSAKLEGSEFLGFRTNQAKWQQSILMIGEHT
jgi:hypothetical protein